MADKTHRPIFDDPLTSENFATKATADALKIVAAVIKTCPGDAVYRAAVCRLAMSAFEQEIAAKTLLATIQGRVNPGDR